MPQKSPWYWPVAPEGASSAPSTTRQWKAKPNAAGGIAATKVGEDGVERVRVGEAALDEVVGLAGDEVGGGGHALSIAPSVRVASH